MNREQAKAFIIHYENNREKDIERFDTAIKKSQEALDLLIEHNLAYFQYGEAKGWFTIPEERKREEALHNSLTSITGRAIKWDIGEARALAFEILQDVNDHDMAAKVAKLLELDKSG